VLGAPILIDGYIIGEVEPMVDTPILQKYCIILIAALAGISTWYWTEIEYTPIGKDGNCARLVTPLTGASSATPFNVLLLIAVYWLPTRPVGLLNANKEFQDIIY